MDFTSSSGTTEGPVVWVGPEGILDTGTNNSVNESSLIGHSRFSGEMRRNVSVSVSELDFDMIRWVMDAKESANVRGDSCTAAIPQH